MVFAPAPPPHLPACCRPLELSAVGALRHQRQKVCEVTLRRSRRHGSTPTKPYAPDRLPPISHAREEEPHHFVHDPTPEGWNEPAHPRKWRARRFSAHEYVRARQTPQNDDSVCAGNIASRTVLPELERRHARKHRVDKFRQQRSSWRDGRNPQGDAREPHDSRDSLEEDEKEDRRTPDVRSSEASSPSQRRQMPDGRRRASGEGYESRDMPESQSEARQPQAGPPHIRRPEGERHSSHARDKQGFPSVSPEKKRGFPTQRMQAPGFGSEQPGVYRPRENPRPSVAPKGASYMQLSMKNSLSLPSIRRGVLKKAEVMAVQQLSAVRQLPTRKARDKAFKELLRLWHPDKNPQNLDVATAVFQLLQAERSRVLSV